MTGELDRDRWLGIVSSLGVPETLRHIAAWLEFQQNEKAIKGLRGTTTEIPELLGTHGILWLLSHVGLVADDEQYLARARNTSRD